MSNDVTYQREDYRSAQADWLLVDDVCDGKVKSKGDTYLLRPNPLDVSRENRARYEQYNERAVFYNATGRTLQGLVGTVFRKWPVLNLASALKYVENDVDGAGVSIYQQSQRVLSEVNKKGRHALLVDYPSTDGSTSIALQRSNSIRASVISVKAEQVINWQTEKVGGVHRLTLVVISEKVEQKTEDGFGVVTVDQYRVLRLVEGRYTVEVWRKVESKWSIDGPYEPKDGSGQYWNVIPFVFVGSQNNDPHIDRSTLLDLARINIAHYRNSADYEDNVFFIGQAQPWISGLDEEWRNHLEGTGIYIGSRSPVMLPVGGAFGFAQVLPNTIVKEAMDQKERQMVALGARIIDRSSAVKTATEAQAENESEHSALSLIASNVSEAYTLALSWVAMFMNSTEEVEYTLNQEFVEHSIDAQMLTALVGAWQSGRLPSSDLWAKFKKSGLIDPEKDDEKIKDELENEDEGLGLDDDTE